MNAPSVAWFLQQALTQARQAAEAGEVPVGAIVVKNGQVIATGRNAPLSSHDPTAHAEIVALRAAAARLGNYRLDGCELYVTLEPCAMCAGAIAHARLSRLVYAAHDPRAGACGSTLNVLGHKAINHHTEVLSATDLGANYIDLVSASGQILQDFFQKKRLANSTDWPLREDALRTPESRFESLPGYAFSPHYINDLPSLSGLRLHYLDEGARDAHLTYLCLHGNPTWSYLYRKMIPIFAASGARVVAPDMIGFGKSDKPKKDSFHSFRWHRQCLIEFIERLDLKNTVAVVQDWGGLLGLTLPHAMPDRIKGLVVMNTWLACGQEPLTEGFKAWREMFRTKPDFDIARLLARGHPQLSEAECAAYMAPFPDSGHRAATRALPWQVPEFDSSDGAAICRDALVFWRNHWDGASLMAIGMQDPVFTPAVMHQLHTVIRNCEEPMLIDTAGHFVPEHGEAIAHRAMALFGNG